MNRFSSFLNVVKEIVGIINESRKLFLKNKKLMFSVLLFPLLLSCLVLLFTIFSIKPEVTNLIAELSLLPTADPTSPDYASHLMRIFYDFRVVLVSSYIFTLVYFIINLISVIIIVHASALTHKDEGIKIKEFPVLTFKSWKGPLVTNFYITLFTLGYWLLFFIIYYPIVVLSTNFIFLATKLLVLLIIFAVFESYLAIAWNLAMVISILEDTYGFQALGKAAKIAKGMKPKLFLLNLFFGLLLFGLAQFLRLINWRSSFSTTLITGLVFVSLVFVVRMFQLVTYTIAYYQCKSRQENDVESARDVEYTKLPSNTLP